MHGRFPEWSSIDLKSNIWLVQEAKSEWETPRVSPYRLAAHLTSAAIIYGTLLWTTLSLAYPLSPAATLTAGKAAQAGVNTLRRWALPIAGLIAVTALSGRAALSAIFDDQLHGMYVSCACLPLICSLLL